MKRNMWVAGLVVAALGTAPVFAQDAPQSQVQVMSSTGAKSLDAMARAQNDAALANQIARQVRRYVNYSIFDDVNIEVEGGVATLSGRVTMPYKAKDLGRVATKVRGVTEVKNELEVLPVSIGDDRLRRSIARQIYGNGLFQPYAFHVNPPIHIIVERGNVTLTGAVSSEVERVKAEMIVRSTFGVFGVENRLVVAS
jgi:osmotically-inducible protein OsmY